MKIVKKIFLMLFVFFVGIITVNAETKNIKVTSVTVKEKSSTIEVADPVISNNEITSNITFNQVNDYVTFELTLKNNESEKYKITSITDNNTSNNIEVEYDYPKDFISSNDEAKVRVKLTYKSQLTNSNASLNNLTIILTIADSQGDTSQIVLNPNTGDNILHFLVLLIIAVTGLILIVRKKKIKIGVLVLAIGLIIIPFAVLAEEKFEINFKFTNIEVKGEFEEYNITIDKGDGSEPTVLSVTYGEKIGELPEAPAKEGHTFIGWIDEQNREATEDTVITGPITITPVYKKDKHTLTINHPEYIVEGDLSGEYEYGTQITLTAKEQDGYTFSKWSDDSTDNPRTLTIGTSDIIIEPIYIENRKITTTFKKGETVNETMKALSKADSSWYLSDNYTILHIEKSTTSPDISELTNENIVSTDDSETPLYMWYEESSKTIYWWTAANEIYLNEDSSDLFGRLRNLQNIDVSEFNTTKVNNMASLFNFDEKLIELDLKDWDTSNVLDIYGVFYGCSRLKELDLSTWNTSNVRRMDSVFSLCKNLTDLNISTWDTSNVLTMSHLFSECTSLKELDLSSFDTQKVRQANRMFYKIPNLEKIIVSDKFDLSSIQYNDQNNCTWFFYNADKLTGESGTKYTDHLEDYDRIYYARIDGGVNHPGYFTSNLNVVTFNPNGGSTRIESINVQINNKIGSLPIPFRDGYKFEGWYTDQEEGDKITSETVITSNIIVYAHWIEKDSSELIEYYDNGDNKVGLDDYVKFENDEFWVIGTTQEGNIKLLAKYNLDSEYRQSENNYESMTYSENEYWNMIPSTTSNSMLVYPDPETPHEGLKDYQKGLSEKYYVYRNKNDKDTDNNLKKYINNYKNHLVGDLGINGIIDAKVLSYEEANDLCTVSNTRNVNKCPSNISNQDYWLGTLVDINSSDIYSIKHEYNSLLNYLNYTNSLGVRPLIIVSSEIIDKKYTVTFDTNGKIDIGKAIYLEDNDNNILELPNVKAEDSIFDGWYSDNSYENKLGDRIKVDKNTTVYAKLTSCNNFAYDSWTTINEKVVENPSYYPIGCERKINPLGQNDNTNKVRVINNTSPEICNTPGFSQTGCGFVLEYVSGLEGGFGEEHEEWDETDNRAYLNNEIYNSLPEELRNSIIDTPTITNVFLDEKYTFVTAYRAKPYKTIETIDKIYLLGVQEVYGETLNQDIPITNTRQLDYYSKNNVSLTNFSIATKPNYNGYPSGWYLRENICAILNEGEPCYDYYYSVGDTGYIGNYMFGYAADYIVPVFRIGKAN